MRFFLLAFVMLILIPTWVLANSQKYIGIGLGLWGAATDSNYEVNKNTIPVPVLGGDWEYFSVEIPFLFFRGDNRPINFRLGINNHSLNLREITTSFPQEDHKSELTFEISILTLYLTYLSEKTITENLALFYEVGPTLIESVLTKATETFQLSTGDDGSPQQKHTGIQKSYQIDYGMGVTLSVGITYQFTSSDRLGFQLSHFHQPSDLSFAGDNNANLSNTQFRLFYLFAFD